MFCYKCGTENPETTRFCMKCGTKVIVPDEREPDPAAGTGSPRSSAAPPSAAPPPPRSALDVAPPPPPSAQTDQGASTSQRGSRTAPGPPSPAPFAGLWGPAGPFPEVVESLEAGRWLEARQRAELLRKGDPDAPGVVLMLLFVRLLSDMPLVAESEGAASDLAGLADEAVCMLPRSGVARYLRGVTSLLTRANDHSVREAMFAEALGDATVAEAANPDAVDCGVIAMVVAGLKRDAASERGLNEHGNLAKPPSSLLGRLLLATALQMDEPKDLTPEEASQLVGDAASTEAITETWLKADRGLKVLGPWRNTAVEPELMGWLAYCRTGHDRRRRATIAACHRLVQILRRPGRGQEDLLALAVAELKLAELVGFAPESDLVFRRLSDQAAMTAWRHISDSAPPGVIVLSSVPRRYRDLPRLGNREDEYLFTDTVWGSPIRRPQAGACVVRYDSDVMDITGISLKQLQRDPDAGYRIYPDGFHSSRHKEFIPFAAVSKVVIKGGLMRTRVTVIGDDGTRIMNNAAMSKVAARALNDNFQEWRRKWGNIADRRARPRNGA